MPRNERSAFDALEDSINDRATYQRAIRKALRGPRMSRLPPPKPLPQLRRFSDGAVIAFATLAALAFAGAYFFTITNGF